MNTPKFSRADLMTFDINQLNSLPESLDLEYNALIEEVKITKFGDPEANNKKLKGKMKEMFPAKTSAKTEASAEVVVEVESVVEPVVETTEDAPVSMNDSLAKALSDKEDKKSNTTNK